MATASERTWFRLELGLDDDESVFTDSEIDGIYETAAVDHPGDATLTGALALVIGVRRLKRKTVSLTDYDQGESSEKLSQVFKHLAAVESDIKAEYYRLRAQSQTPMRMGRLKKVPSRQERYP